MNQEELKVWEIIKAKPDELGFILQEKNYEMYVDSFREEDRNNIPITEEQFNLVKSYFAKEKKTNIIPVVINTSFGGITEETAKQRFDAKFAEDVRNGNFTGRVHKGFFGGFAETLKVVDIPDTATDIRIVNYDGCEGVLYAINGKIYYEGSRECGEIFNTEY